MTTIENVMKGLECCVGSIQHCFDAEGNPCPYFGTSNNCDHMLLVDIFPVLKELIRYVNDKKE